ncbi:hypothetical protein OG250_07140 [Streptomyces sp. NBC_00487]|uniref:hypothetical protein n=1 Tax=unclassified Streptomyces TaxID=2593676 RepID=UPI002E19BF1F|nr:MULTISPECIES: hypothetical protein [unclassified Streptomyces]
MAGPESHGAARCGTVRFPGGGHREGVVVLMVVPYGLALVPTLCHLKAALAAPRM